jgi:hypothetical protein
MYRLIRCVTAVALLGAPVATPVAMAQQKAAPALTHVRVYEAPS